jgi:ubiquinone/menaquinone biosynthesis C-methylase UbiE
MSNQNIWKLNERERYKQERRARVIASFLSPTPADVVLDIGCAEGFTTSHLLKAGFVVGLDVSKNSLLVAREKVRQSNVQFVCADATLLPIRTGAFKKIVMLEILEHLPEDAQKKLCEEADRVLNENGVLIVSVPYKEEITYTKCIHCGKLTPLWGHLHSMDEEKCKSLLPNHYTLTTKCHLPNVAIISLSRIFRHLPLSLWLVLNNSLGRVRKGYWILLKFKKDVSRT